MSAESPTRERLLQVTRTLIDEGGIEAVNLREVGRRVGVSRSALYRHFLSKEDLLSAIVVENFTNLYEQLKHGIQGITNPKEALMTLFTGYCDYAIAYPSQYFLMFRMKWEETIYAPIRVIASQVHLLVVEVVRMAQAGKIIPDGSEIEITAILYAFIHGLVDLSLSGHSEVTKGLNDKNVLMTLLLDIFYMATIANENHNKSKINQTKI